MDAGEPAGRWYGGGAAQLGLAGEVDSDLLEAVYLHRLDPRDENAHSRATWGLAETLGSPPKVFPSAEQLYGTYLEAEPDAIPERRAELRALAEQRTQQNVSFTDFTFSPQKSITVAAVAFERAANLARAAGHLEEAADWERMHQKVEDAVMAGARASIDYLEEHGAFARRGHHGGGAGKWIDAPNLTVAQFLQHDSRAHDPQLHVHQAVWNQVRGVDGKYTSIDGRSMREVRAAAEAVGGRVMEAITAEDPDLRFRFQTRADGVREVVGVDRDLCALMSSRDQAITGKTAELLAGYVERFGCEPPRSVLNQLKQQATLATRAAKSHQGETQEERLERWDRETRTTVADGLKAVAETVKAGRETAAGPDGFDPVDVMERAVRLAAAKDTAWSRSDLMREVSAALPANLGVDPSRVGHLLDRLTDEALRSVKPVNPVKPGATPTPTDLQRRDGRSVYARPSSERYVAPGQLHYERMLRQGAVRRDAYAVPVESVKALLTRYAEAGKELGVDQAAAVRGLLTDRANIAVMAAPAGAGKSFVVGAVAEGFTLAGRTVYGLAPSQVAADVLTDEGVKAANIERWLHTQAHLRGHGKEREGDSSFTLREGDCVVVDEAGMASTTQLARIHEICERADAKMVLVGDPRQLGAVGPGGTLSDLGEHAQKYELVEVRRFQAPWEKQASLGLRNANADALNEYEKHGRLLTGGTQAETEQSALRAWLADTLNGRESLLIASTNELAGKLAGAARGELIRMGALEDAGSTVLLGRDGNTAGPGDIVQARQNAWHLAETEGRAPINRTTYRVQEVHEDGSLTVAPRGPGADKPIAEGGTAFRLPADYVQANLALGYAGTIHTAQSRTVDTCHPVIDRMTSTAAAYVAMTRGRLGNWAHVVTKGAPADLPAGAAQDVQERSARAELRDLLERGGQDTSALQQMTEAEEAAKSTFVNVGQLLDNVSGTIAGRTTTALDQLEAEGVLSEADRIRLAADGETGAVDRLLRAAELTGRDRTEVLREALASGNLADARSPGTVLYSRVQARVGDVAAGTVGAFRDLVPPDVPEGHRPWLEELAETADERRWELGVRVAEEAPAWALNALGRVPDDVMARMEWEHKAGWAGAYRELAEHADDTDPLGTPPPAGLPEKHSIWRTAHEALDLPDAAAEERTLSDGALRVRAAAYEREKSWAPRFVAEELAASYRAADRERTNAALYAARAAQLDDPEERATLEEAAQQARAEHERMQETVDDLTEADTARGRWYAATAPTREYAYRAGVELAARGVDRDDPAAKVTAEEWLSAQADGQAQEERAAERESMWRRGQEAVREYAGTVSGWFHRREQDTAKDEAAEETKTAYLDQVDELQPETADTEPASAYEEEPVVDVETAHTQQQATDAAAEDMRDAYLDGLDTDNDDEEEAPPDWEEVAGPTDPDAELETVVPEQRERQPDPSEDRDTAPPDRIPTVDEARAAVERAREAMAEVEAREAADAARVEDEWDQRAAVRDTDVQVDVEDDADVDA